MFKFNYIQFLILLMIFSFNVFAQGTPGACEVTVSGEEHEFMNVFQADCEDELSSHVTYAGTLCTVEYAGDSWSLETTQEDCLAATSTWEAQYIDPILCAPALPDPKGPLRITSTGFYAGGNQQCLITTLLNMNINKDASLNKRRLLREMLRCLIKAGKGYLIHRPPNTQAEQDLLYQCKLDAIKKLTGKTATWEYVTSPVGKFNNLIVKVGWTKDAFTEGANSPCRQARTAQADSNKRVSMLIGNWAIPNAAGQHIVAVSSIKCDPPDGENSIRVIDSNGSSSTLNFDSNGTITTPGNYQNKKILEFAIEKLQ